jgi:Tfp pilus assembly protein PilF
VASKVARSLPCSLVMLKAEDAIRLKIDQELSDLRTHYERGVELLEHGFLEEARREFEHCVETHDMMFLPAWESLAETFDRLGKPDRAKQCRETAQRILDAISWRQVEADVRRHHPLWNRGGAPR